MYFIFFFQAEDGIRDLVRSRGLGDVYKRQAHTRPTMIGMDRERGHVGLVDHEPDTPVGHDVLVLSLIHI